MTDVDVLVEFGMALAPVGPAKVAFSFDLDVELLPRRVGARWRLVAGRWVGEEFVAVDGGWLDKAVAETFTFAPCTYETFAFTMPATDAKTRIFAETKYQEVQVWFGDEPVAWGVAKQPEWQADGTVVVQCAGVAWIPMERRGVGPARRGNNLHNGTFTEGDRLDYWATMVYDEANHAYLGQDDETNISVVAHPTLTRYNAVRIVDNSAGSLDGNRLGCVAQEFRLNASGTPLNVTLRARVLVERFDAANSHRTGLTLIELPVGYTDPFADALQVRTGSPALDKEHPVGTVVDHTCTLTIPWSGNDRIVLARLDGCRGVVLFTDVWLEHDDRLGFEDEQALIFLAICDHLTGNPYGGFLFSRVHPDYPWFNEPYNKSWCHIFCESPWTGIKRQRDYFFAQRPSGSSALGEFAALDDGLEWSTRYSRNRRHIFSAHPKLGRYRPDCRITSINGRGNCPQWNWAFRGDQGASSITVQPSREGWREGNAIDTAVFGGLTIEDSIAAPPEANRDALDAVAARKLRSAKNPATLKALIPFDYWADRGLKEYDRIDVLLKRGELTVDGRWWLRRLAVTPGAPYAEADLIPWTWGE